MKQKKVAIFFVEGYGVKSLTQAKSWLANFPELIAIAEIKPFFVEAKPNIGSPDFWQTLAKKIHQEWSRYDGFVVFHAPDSIIYTASAISFGIELPNKPIVFTGAFGGGYGKARKLSRQNDLEELSARANLINAIQVAIMDIAEVVLVSGNRLIRATHAERSANQTYNAFETDNAGLLGKIDFSINIFPQAKKRTKKNPTISSFFEKNIAVIDIFPGLSVQNIPDLVKGKKGALILARDGSLISEIFDLFKKNNLPIAVFHIKNNINPHFHNDIITSGTFTIEAALTKFMWALGRKKAALQDVRAIFLQNIAGERHEKGGRI